MNIQVNHHIWWSGEPDGAQADGDWIQYAMEDGDAASKHMGQQQHALTMNVTRPHGIDVGGSPFPDSSIESDGSSSSWTNSALEHSMIEYDPDILGWLGLHPSQESGLASLAKDHATDQNLNALSSHDHTQSLTISPLTSSISDFSLPGSETDKLLSPSMPSKSCREAPCTEKSNMKRKHTLKTKSAAVKRHLKKGFDCGKTSATHPFECKECGMRFRQRGELRKHENAVHRSEGQRPHACSHCDKRFNWPKDVKRHEERVHRKTITGTERCSSNESMDHDLFGDGPPENVPDMEMLDDSYADFQLFFEDDDYDCSSDLTMQQDWLCKNNNPDHNTFSRTHSPGEGSAPHRGARV